MRIDDNNPAFMKEYLKQVVTFEKAVYTWGKALKTANNKCNSLNQEKNGLNQTKELKSKQLNSIDSEVERKVQQSKNQISRLTRARSGIIKAKNIVVAILVIAIVIAVILSVMVLLDALSIDLEDGEAIVLSLAWGLAFTVLQLSIPALIILNILKNRMLSSIEKHKENLKNSAHITQGLERKQQLSRELADTSSGLQRVTELQTIALENKSKIQTALNDAKKVLDDLYAMDVLPEKYRSLNASATLYEFLANGVCTIVKGHGGIYDTYEYHIRLGIIIAKLDDILSKLDSIIDNQNYLYQAISECNSKLNKIDNDIISSKKAFDASSAALLELQSQTNATVQYYAWKNS